MVTCYKTGPSLVGMVLTTVVAQFLKTGGIEHVRNGN